MKNYNLYQARRQAGMTLIELTVVLLILIGLAGMLIPYVTGFVGKTHQSTSAQTIAELNNAINRYESQFFNDPDRYDTLTASSTATTILGGTMGVMGKSQYVGETLSANALAALNAAGIKTAVVPPSTDLTYGVGTQYTLSTSQTLSRFDSTNYTLPSGSSSNGIAEVQRALGIPSTDKQAYVAFGIGGQSQMIGNTMFEAPIHFHETSADPATTYSRFIAVYGIPSTNNTFAGATANGTAKFLGVVGPMNPVEAAGGHIQEYRQASFAQ